MAAGSALAWSAVEAAAGPNFVFVLADDWGWGDVGFTGSNAVIHTPNLDSIATHGITFTDFHVSVFAECLFSRGDCGSACAPSRRTMKHSTRAFDPRHVPVHGADGKPGLQPI